MAIRAESTILVNVLLKGGERIAIFPASGRRTIWYRTSDNLHPSVILKDLSGRQARESSRKALRSQGSSRLGVCVMMAHDLIYHLRGRLVMNTGGQER